MDRKEQVKQVMLSTDIPPGQLTLYKALLDEPVGLTLKELATASGDRSTGEITSTLGALGSRVTQSGVTGLEKPSRLMIDKSRDGYYGLTSEMLDFIKATPDLENALRNTEMSKFFLHTATAYAFFWNSNKTGGELREFERKNS